MLTATLEILDAEDLSECSLCGAEFDGLAIEGDCCPACAAREAEREAAQAELDEAQDGLDTLLGELAELQEQIAEARKRVRETKKTVAKLEK
jgi:peptidoglycan hydrolase CwlO-like protein